MSTPIEIANDIKAAILELAGGRDYPDLLEAVDSLLIRSSNKGYAQGVIDGKAIGPESGEQLYRRIATYEGIGKIVATYEPVTCPAPAQAPEPSSAVKASEHVDEIRATLTGAHAIMESVSSLERRVGPVGSHARGYTHKLTAAIRHLDALAAKSEPRAPVLKAVGSMLPANWRPSLDHWCREVLLYSPENPGDYPERRVTLYILAAASQAPGAGGEGA